METILFRARGLSFPAVGFAVCFLTRALHAQWSEDFDSYPAGDEIIGQGDWAGWDANPAAGARVSDAEASSPPNSLAVVQGTDLVHLFDVQGGRWSLRAQVFIPSGHTGATWLILLNQYQAVAGSNNWSTQIRFSEGKVVSHGGSNFFSRTGAGAPLIADQWTEVRVDFDLDQNLQTVYYDGKFLHQTSWQYDGTDTFQAIDLYSDGGSVAYFDDLSLDDVPAEEPDCNRNGVPDAQDIARATSRDCNKDGVPDECLASGNLSADSQTLPAWMGPVSLVAVDLDDDGEPDLAVAANTASGVTVLLNTGPGAFTGQDYGLGAPPAVIGAADLYGTGRLDLIVTHPDARNLSVLPNEGDGTFAVKRGYTVPDRPFGLAAARLVNDDAIDVAVVGGNSSLWLFGNDGTGTLKLSRTLAVASLPNRLVAADLDGDGDDDLASANISLNSLSVVLRTGPTAFSVKNLPIGEGASILTAVDLDGDQDLDLAGLGAGQPGVDVASSTLWLLRNDGKAAFGTAETCPLGSVAGAIASADLNGDGFPDLAAAGARQDVWVLPGNGLGGFSRPLSFTAGDGPTGIAAADLDRDGKLDLAVSNFNSNDVALLLNRTDAKKLDCNRNRVPDSCDIGAGTSPDTNRDGIPDECAPGGPNQLPGDCNQDGEFDLSDAVCTLGFLFLGDPTRLPCGDGTLADPGNLALIDWQPDGSIDLTDGIGILSYLFTGGPPHPLMVPGRPGACASIPGCGNDSACR